MSRLRKLTDSDITARTDWGDAFWQRFYQDPDTRIASSQGLHEEGQWLALTLKARLGIQIASAIDLGSGNGCFADGLQAQLEWCQVRRIDLHAPDEFAKREDACSVDLAGYDLIICRDFIHYLDDMPAHNLLHDMARSGAKALYLRVATTADTLDARSDTEIIRRDASWYQRRLTGYAHLRFGLLLKLGQSITLGALE